MTALLSPVRSLVAVLVSVAVLLGLTVDVADAAQGDLPADVDTVTELIDWAVGFTAADLGEDDIARVEHWYGPEVRAVIRTAVSTFIEIPPEDRLANQQAILDEFTALANARAVEVYRAAVGEAQEWQVNDCTYDPGASVPYERPARCQRSPLATPASNGSLLADVLEAIQDGTEPVPTPPTFLAAAYGDSFPGLSTPGAGQLRLYDAMAIATGAGLAVGFAAGGAATVALTSGLSAAVASATTASAVAEATAPAVLGPVFGKILPWFAASGGFAAAAIIAPIAIAAVALATIGVLIWATVEVEKNQQLRATLVDRVTELADFRASTTVPFEDMLRTLPEGVLEGDKLAYDGLEASIADAVMIELMAPDPARAPYAVVLDGCDRFSTQGVGSVTNIQTCNASVAAALDDRPSPTAEDLVFRDLDRPIVQHSPLSILTRQYDPDASPEDEEPFRFAAVDVMVTDDTFSVDEGAGARWSSTVEYYGTQEAGSPLTLLRARIVPPASAGEPLQFLVTDLAFEDPEDAVTGLYDELHVLVPDERGVDPQLRRVGLRERIDAPTFLAGVTPAGESAPVLSDAAEVTRMTEADRISFLPDDLGGLDSTTIRWAVERPTQEYDDGLGLEVTCSSALDCYEPADCSLSAFECPTEDYYYSGGTTASFVPGDDTVGRGPLVAYVFAEYLDGTPFEETFLIEVEDVLPEPGDLQLVVNGVTLPPGTAGPVDVPGLASIGAAVAEDPGSNDVYELAVEWSDGLRAGTAGLTPDDCQSNFRVEGSSDPLDEGSGLRLHCNGAESPAFQTADLAARNPYIWRALPDGFGDRSLSAAVTLELRGRSTGGVEVPAAVVNLDDPAVTSQQTLSVLEDGAVSLNDVFDTIAFDDPSVTPEGVGFRFEHVPGACTLSPDDEPGGACLARGTVQIETLPNADGSIDVCVPTGPIECPRPYSYRPLPDVNGTDRVEYSFCYPEQAVGEPLEGRYAPDFGGCVREHAYVDIAIQPVNDPVAATDRALTVSEDTPRSIGAAQLFSDLETQAGQLDLTFDTGGSPLLESVEAHSAFGAQAVHVSPAPHATGTVDVLVTATDRGDPDGCATSGTTPCAEVSSATAVLSVEITPVPDDPTATLTGPDTVVETAPAPFAFRLADVDEGDTVQLDGPPSCGTGTLLDSALTDPAAGTFRCVFDADQPAATVSVTAVDSTGRTVTETLDVAVEEDLPPVPGDGSLTVVDGWSGELTLGGDPNSDVLTYEVVDPPTKGTVEVGDDGRLRYVSRPGARGTDTFVVEVCDATSCVESTITVQIEPFEPADAPPSVVTDTLTVLPEVFGPGDSIRVVAAGLPPGETVRIVLYSTPVELGTALVGDDGTVDVGLVVPEGTEVGDHTVTLFSSDGSLSTAVAVQADVAGDGGVVDGAPDGRADSELPVTGATTTGATSLAMLLLLVGVFLVAAPWRRRRLLA